MIVTTTRLERELAQEKSALADNIDALQAKAREVTDWRAQVGRRPWASLGIALLAGSALAMLVRPRSGGRSRSPGAGQPSFRRAPGRSAVGTLQSLRSHPAVARVVGTLTAVAAAKAMRMFHDVAPTFAEEYEKQAPER